MPSKVIPVPPFTITVLGATGDLASRKLLPSLWRRAVSGQAPMDSRIIGAARTKMNDGEFRAHAEKCLQESGALNGSADNAMLREWLSHLRYVQLSAQGEQGWNELQTIIADSPSPRLFYLAVAPDLAAPLCKRLHKANMLGEQSRLILEKPFGSDLQSARELNKIVRACAEEKQIYRIDHYLGKETVQNLMALRFANALLEPVWNARAIEHIQITVAESVGVAGRGDYYDKAGAVRDMLQNHLLQLLCLTAMESPASYTANDVRDEKLKVLHCLRPLNEQSANNVVTGQYESYKQDAGAKESKTETFVAVKCEIDNWRWSGAPFYLRTGKRLSARMSEIAVCFRAPPHSIFPSAPSLAGNILAVRLQPREGVTMNINVKERGPGGFRLSAAALDMSFSENPGDEPPDAYERLLMDVVRGDQTLFMRDDELEAAWRWTDPVAKLAAAKQPQQYARGGDGPEDALRLITADGGKWREIQ